MCFITAEEKKEPTTDTNKKEEKNDSDSEDEGKKERQRFKSERPKEQHKFEKQEQSMWKKWMNGCSKSVSPILSSLEKLLIILTLWKCILQIDTDTIFALTVKIRCLVINCSLNGKKVQNVICSFKISKNLFVCVSDIDKISTVVLLPVIVRLSLTFPRYKFNFRVGCSVVTCSYLYLFNLYKYSKQSTKILIILFSFIVRERLQKTWWQKLE